MNPFELKKNSAGALRFQALSPFIALLILVAFAVPALQGVEKAPDEAKPFDPKGWSTATDYPAIGDPKAKRVPGSRFTHVWESFPPTLRTDGPNSNLVQTSNLHGLMYESLIQIHPETEEYIPCLASHWKIETHKKEGYQIFGFGSILKHAGRTVLK